MCIVPPDLNAASVPLIPAPPLSFFAGAFPNHPRRFLNSASAPHCYVDWLGVIDHEHELDRAAFV